MGELRTTTSQHEAPNVSDNLIRNIKAAMITIPCSTASQLASDLGLSAREVQLVCAWLTTEDGGEYLAMRGGVYRITERGKIDAETVVWGNAENQNA